MLKAKLGLFFEPDRSQLEVDHLRAVGFVAGFLVPSGPDAKRA